MKSIANLAADGPAPKKRRKGGDGELIRDLPSLFVLDPSQGASADFPSPASSSF